MTEKYSPSLEAQPHLPWNVTLLSQRDVSLRVPVNFLTTPGVGLTPACFAHGVYEHNAAVQCLSNLLATGFRRFELDVYWDSTRLSWSLCPVQIPTVQAGGQNITSPLHVSTTIAPLSGASFPALKTDAISIVSSFIGTTSDQNLHVRDGTLDRQIQSSSSPQELSALTMMKPNGVAIMSPTKTVSHTPAQQPITVMQSLESIGPYTCGGSLDLSLLTGLFNDYFVQSGNTLEAALIYLIFNIHAAATDTDPLGPAPQPNSSTLPIPSNTIGQIFDAALSSYLYTPELLSAQRADLNISWLAEVNATEPDSSYYVDNFVVDDQTKSPGGWPSEGFVEFQKAGTRLLLGFGTTDPQMAEYNFQNDQGIIFSNQELTQPRHITTTSNGTVLNGCIFDRNATSLQVVNSSWATAYLGSPDLDSFPAFVSNITACGISPILNTTIQNATADVNVAPYQSFAYNSIWSWAADEPKNYTDGVFADIDNDDDTKNDYRCAVFDSSLLGRWRVEICQNHHPAACRSDDSPYLWQIASSKGTYSQVNDNCPTNFTFAAPRSALENRYLRNAYQLRTDMDASVVWINLNSLDVESCWVQGINSTCPYAPKVESIDREVVVPTVAGIIVLVMALLTILVKCTANRQKSRKRRRIDSGWDYEGVPS